MENKILLEEILELTKELRRKTEAGLPAINALNARVDQLEIAAKRPQLFEKNPNLNPESAEFKAFDKWMRKGKEALDSYEVKALIVSSDPAAGYLCPPEFDTEIIKGISEFSPIRQIAKIRQISGESLETPRKKGTGDAYWISEIAERTEVAGFEIGMEKTSPHEMAYLLKASLKQIEDSKYNLEAEVSEELVDAFARLEGAAFVNGNGVNKPEGILTNGGVGSYLSEDADDISPEGIIALPFQIKSGYLTNGTYILNRTSLWKIRTFKDPVTGLYLWQPAFAATTPPTICGFPYLLCPDLPDPAADAYPVVFGDFRRAYLIVDRMPSMSIQRLVEKYAELGQVGFLGRRRVDGQVVLPEAIVKLKCDVTE
jgi:HK97 family phage major capsid protein